MAVPPEFRVSSLNTGMEFLRTELSVALIFASLAEAQRKCGHYEAAKRNMADARTGYSELIEFLSEPNCEKFMKPDEQAEFAAALERLRSKLDLAAA